MLSKEQKRLIRLIMAEVKEELEYTSFVILSLSEWHYKTPDIHVKGDYNFYSIEDEELLDIKKDEFVKNDLDESLLNEVIDFLKEKINYNIAKLETEDFSILIGNHNAYLSHCDEDKVEEWEEDLNEEQDNLEPCFIRALDNGLLLDYKNMYLDKYAFFLEGDEDKFKEQLEEKGLKFLLEYKNDINIKIENCKEATFELNSPLCIVLENGLIEAKESIKIQIECNLIEIEGFVVVPAKIVEIDDTVINEIISEMECIEAKNNRRG